MLSTSIDLPNSSEPASAGTLAHRALEQWIRSEGYRADSPSTALAEAADACLEATGQDRPRQWPLVAARLKARAAGLAVLIGSRTVAEVVSETELRDPLLRLRGTPDLLLLGSEMVLVDLKTQTLKDDRISEWATFQLNLYAHLVSATYGRYPERVELFSLNRGRIPISVTNQSALEAIEALAAARIAVQNEARPSSTTCFYCQRRFGCQPHWNAAQSWSERDCVQGMVQRIEVAANGLAAVEVQEENATTWISGIPLSNIEEGAVGDRIRLVRLRRISADSDSSEKWHWRNGSAVWLEIQPGLSAG